MTDMLQLSGVLSDAFYSNARSALHYALLSLRTWAHATAESSKTFRSVCHIARRVSFDQRVACQLSQPVGCTAGVSHLEHTVGGPLSERRTSVTSSRPPHDQEWAAPLGIIDESEMHNRT